MSNGKIYIAGKITGDPDYTVKFEAGVLHMLRLGWEYDKIVNPVKHCKAWWPWWRCMVRCTRLLAGCEWVAMLPDWRESRGVRWEHRVARWMRKYILYINFLKS